MRKVFTIVSSPDLHLVHYIQSDATAQILPSLIKVYPVDRKLDLKRKWKKTEDQFGDTLDLSFGRLAALDRYKRNHTFMHLILSPNSTGFSI
jgi:hypothetical protein